MELGTNPLWNKQFLLSMWKQKSVARIAELLGKEKHFAVAAVYGFHCLMQSKKMKKKDRILHMTYKEVDDEFSMPMFCSTLERLGWIAEANTGDNSGDFVIYIPLDAVDPQDRGQLTIDTPKVEEKKPLSDEEKQSETLCWRFAKLYMGFGNFSPKRIFEQSRGDFIEMIRLKMISPIALELEIDRKERDRTEKSWMLKRRISCGDFRHKFENKEQAMLDYVFRFGSLEQAENPYEWHEGFVSFLHEHDINIVNF